MKIMGYINDHVNSLKLGVGVDPVCIRINKTEYHQLLAEFDHLQIPNYYETIEISVLYRSLPTFFH